MAELPAIASRIPLLHNARALRQLTNGPVCDKWLLDTGGERVVLRVDRPLAARAGINRRSEMQALHCLADAGWQDEPLWADADSGVLVLRWVPGDVWTSQQLRQPDNLNRLAGVLYRLHRLPTAQWPDFALAERLRCYARAIGTQDAAQCATETIELLSVLTRDAAGARVCHNDPVAGNLIDGEQLRLIDFEYAGVGDPLFDLAVVIEHHELTADETAHLLGAYTAAGGDCDPARLQLWREVYDATVRLWAATLA